MKTSHLRLKGLTPCSSPSWHSVNYHPLQEEASLILSAFLGTTLLLHIHLAHYALSETVFCTLETM